MTPERLLQIEEVYHLALEREPGERESYLAEVCGNDGELHRAVTALLAQDSSGGPLEQSIANVMASLLGDLPAVQLASGT